MMMMIMMMKSGFSGPFVILLLNSVVCGLGSVVWKRYHYIQHHYTWQEAQRHCKTHYTDLAFISTESDENAMNMINYHAWVGLFKYADSNSTWKWSDGHYFYSYYWATNEPGNDETCATIYYTNKMFYGTSCDRSFFFICHEKHSNHYEYTFIPQSKSWFEAQQYCKDKYDDLANFKYFSDRSDVIEEHFPVWIGLYRDAGGTLTWSTGFIEYENWDEDEPGNGDCVSISSSRKKMATQDCSHRFPFVCFTDNLFLIKENKTWEEAWEYCQDHQYQLISLQPGEDLYVTVKVMEADTEEVWTGLRFLADEWLWINGVSMLFTDLPLCPPMNRHCGTISKNNTGSIEAADCTEKRNFLCYRP